jgi:hypothetical protein
VDTFATIRSFDASVIPIVNINVSIIGRIALFVIMLFELGCSPDCTAYIVTKAFDVRFALQKLTVEMTAVFNDGTV